MASDAGRPRIYVRELQGKDSGKPVSADRSSRVLELERTVMGLKKALVHCQEKEMATNGVVRRLETALAKAFRDNAALVGATSSGAAVKNVRKVAAEIERSEAMRKMREKVEGLQKVLGDRERHIAGIMRSANATGLVEMAAARDEYYAEVVRLQGVVAEAVKDRDRLGRALERIEVKKSTQKGGEGDEEGDVELLKGVIQAQQARINELKSKVGKSGAQGSPKKQAKSALKERGSLIRKLANGQDLAGQSAAAIRVDTKRRAASKEAAGKRAVLQSWLDEGEGEGWMTVKANHE